MIFYLRNFKSDYAQTNSIVDNIIRQTIETNSVTLIVSIVTLVTFKTQSTTALWFLVGQLNLSKFYLLSLLVALNSRAPLEVEPVSGVPSMTGSRRVDVANVGSGMTKGPAGFHGTNTVIQVTME